MADGTYEYECMRAELLGLEKPDEVEFERVRAERLLQEQQEQEASEAALLEAQEEALRNTGGKLDELNSILTSTQQKLNRFKQTACGSLTNIFSRGSVDVPDGMPGSSNSTRRNTTASGAADELNATAATAGVSDADDDVNATDEQQGIQPIIPTEKIRAAKMDIQKKMSTHLDKLDALINKADNADIAMSEQTKQMRKMAK